MKIMIKVLMCLLVVTLIVFVSGGVYITLSGKKIIISQIEKNLKVKAKLDTVSFSLPFSLNMTGLEIGDFFKAEKISAAPSVLGLLAGKLIFSGITVVNPVINIEQSQDGRFNLPVLEQKGKQPPILLAGLVIKNGKFIFNDKKINDSYKVILEKIDADISKVKFPPTSLNTKFKLSAVLTAPDTKSLGSINCFGWIDFGPKDMDATIDIKGLDVVYFAPYYGNFISNKKLLSASLDLSSGLKAKNNNLAIESKLRLFNLVYEKEEPPKEGEPSAKEGEAPEINVVKNALDFFADEEGNISLDFTINTKLDSPKVDADELKKEMMRSAMKNLSRQSPEALIKKVTGNIDQFKEIGRQLKDMFKKKGE